MTAGWHGRRFFAAPLLFLLAAGLACAAPIKLADDAGRAILLPGPAQRIVSLAPHVTELAFAAGAGERLVGVTSFSDYPAAAKKIPVVGGYGKIDAERILALKPDLVIGWHSGNSGADLAGLEKLHIPVFLTEPNRLEDIPRLIQAIGELAGTQPAAAEAAARFGTDLAELRRRYSGRRPVRVFYEIWHDPLITVNGAHIISDVIGLCGGRNVFSAAASLTPTIAVESVLAADPQAIIASGMLYAKPGPIQDWRRYPRLAAVRGQHLYFVHPDLIHRQTPRILDGARLICEQIARVRN